MVREGSGKRHPLPYGKAEEDGASYCHVLKAGAGMGHMQRRPLG